MFADKFPKRGQAYNLTHHMCNTESGRSASPRFANIVTKAYCRLGIGSDDDRYAKKSIRLTEFVHVSLIQQLVNFLAYIGFVCNLCNIFYEIDYPNYLW